jgi:hypothetical protein
MAGITANLELAVVHICSCLSVVGMRQAIS